MRSVGRAIIAVVLFFIIIGRSIKMGWLVIASKSSLSVDVLDNPSSLKRGSLDLIICIGGRCRRLAICVSSFLEGGSFWYSIIIGSILCSRSNARAPLLLEQWGLWRMVNWDI